MRRLTREKLNGSVTRNSTCHPSSPCATSMRAKVGLPGVHTEPDAVRLPIEIQIADLRRDVARVDEDRPVHVRQDRDARFGVDEDQVAIVEAIVGIRRAASSAPPRAGLQVERHRLSLVGRANQPAMPCANNTMRCRRHRDEVRGFRFVAMKAEPVDPRGPHTATTTPGRAPPSDG